GTVSHVMPRERYFDFAVAPAADGSFLYWTIALLAAIACLGVAGSILFVWNRRSLEKERARWLMQVRELDAKRQSEGMRNSTLAAAVQSLKEQLYAATSPSNGHHGDGGAEPQEVKSAYAEPTASERLHDSGQKGSVPSVPQELVAACKRGQCILYAGRG